MATTRPKRARKKPVVWKRSFAPKRAAWYVVFSTTVEPRVGFAAIAIATVFFFGGVFSIEAAESQDASLMPQAAIYAAGDNQSALVASATYITRIMHVPGGYVDTSSAPPPIGFLK
jgi:hypothetical protein